jgi:hypothetical protein
MEIAVGHRGKIFPRLLPVSNVFAKTMGIPEGIRE